MEAAPQPSLLDNPIWHALSTMHSSLCEGDDNAKRYPPAVTPLGATRDQSEDSYQSLLRLLPPEGAVGVFLDADPALPKGWTLLHHGLIQQMVWHAGPKMKDCRAQKLNASNIDEMLALVELTKPGPFGRRTTEMGRYLGIHKDGRLVAMAGERLRMPGYTEISAVCTHPEHRGNGYATLLVSALVDQITERNEIPFLHVAAENVSAIRVYDKLGFTTRRVIHLLVLKRNVTHEHPQDRSF